MAKSLRIVVIAVEDVETVKSEYERIADSGNTRDGGPVYEYVKHPVSEKFETPVLVQTVEEINLQEIIKAVNNIK